jgi:hypothetical protein
MGIVKQLGRCEEVGLLAGPNRNDQNQNFDNSMQWQQVKSL